MAERTASSRLARLLALVPYVLTHQGVSFADAAAKFGVTEGQLKDDLELIFVSGLPGYTPLELIDVVMDHDSIYIRNADVISKPMRLTTDEALALVLGLQLIEPMAPEEVAALKAKLAEASTVSAGSVMDRFAVVDEPVGPLIHDALQRGRRLLIEYFVPARDQLTEREIDPTDVVVFEGHTYLRAYCRLSESFRLFRLDRIQSAKIVDRPAAPPVEPPGEVLSIEADERVVLELAPSARWLIEHLVAEVISEQPLVASAALSNEDFFVRLALSMADQIKVVSPERLRADIRELAERGKNRYQSS